jgi:hypothetical protein
MSIFEVTFRFKHARYVELVSCTGPLAARRAIRSKYPGVKIYCIRKVG